VIATVLFLPSPGPFELLPDLSLRELQLGSWLATMATEATRRKTCLARPTWSSVSLPRTPSFVPATGQTRRGFYSSPYRSPTATE